MRKTQLKQVKNPTKKEKEMMDKAKRIGAFKTIGKYRHGKKAS